MAATTGTPLSYDRYCAEIVHQADQLRSTVKNTDPAATVPTCPGWNLGQLIRHVNGAHRWVETIVGTRSTEPVSDELVNETPKLAGEDPAELGALLAEGAARLSDTLRAAGPDVPVWTVAPGGTPVFWARRMTHETALHRADATLAAGREYVLDADVARDALDEWMGFHAVEEIAEEQPGAPVLLGPGRTLHFHATDTEAEWFVDLTGEAPVWRPTHEKAAVAVRGTVTDLVLFLYGRPAVAGGVETIGDRELLEVWLERTRFWLR
ncbi:maleylpyruvate isomerase family mycothiol-dependent enzyme [Streptomyces chrestomyceticus]|uniref:Maleylpyruvate isomerase family mycothiol-dependent enzyme n=1 Tax=Streptomyces chrestomyceticus TaxID=68185 RepID=A0ABU7WNA8_9ACTN